jgi:hypothetical protein
MSELGDQWTATILEAINGDRWAEQLVREKFKIPPRLSVGQFFDDLVAAEFGNAPGRDEFNFNG